MLAQGQPKTDEIRDTLRIPRSLESVHPNFSPLRKRPSVSVSAWGIGVLLYLTANAAHSAAAYRNALKANVPNIPAKEKIMPPIIGPIARHALLTPVSRAIALPSRSLPMTSPIIILRTGISAAQAM